MAALASLWACRDTTHLASSTCQVTDWIHLTSDQTLQQAAGSAPSVLQLRVCSSRMYRNLKGPCAQRMVQPGQTEMLGMFQSLMHH